MPILVICYATCRVLDKPSRINDGQSFCREPLKDSIGTVYTSCPISLEPVCPSRHVTEEKLQRGLTLGPV